MKQKTILFCILFEFIIVFQVSAHKPIFEGKNSTFDNPIIVPEHQISYAVYGILDSSADIDYIRFAANRGETFYIQMTVPKIKANKDFKPFIALVGKGIYQRDDVPFKVPEGYGAIVIPPGQYESFYEKFTGTSYYLGQSIIGGIPQSGDFYVAVFSKGSGGKYTLAIGQKESFGILDIIKFPYTYLRVKCFFRPVEAILTAIGAILITAALIVLIKYIVRSGKPGFFRR